MLRITRHRAARRGGTVAGVAGVVAGLLVATAAVAGNWAASGNGPAAAKAGKMKPLVVTAAAPTTLLYPGTTGDAALTVTNPNPIGVTLLSIQQNGDITTATEGCDPTAVTFTAQQGSWTVPKRTGTTDGTLDIVLADAVTMAASAADQCQDATFTIPVTVSTDTLAPRYVALGSGAAIETSNDLTTWTTRSTGLTTTWFDAAYGAGRWVVVGYGGAIATSEDGVTWTSRTSGVTTQLWRVVYNGSIFVAIANSANGPVLTSTDGLSWTVRYTSPAGFVAGPAWNGSTWMVATNSGGPLTAFTPVTSASGSSWTAGSAAGTTGVWDLGWAAGTWVAVGGTGSTGVIYTSTNGTTWTTTTPAGTSTNFHMFASSGSVHLAVAWGAIYRSTNLTSWSEVTTDPPAVNKTKWDGTQFLAASSAGAGTGGVYSSPDGITWTRHAEATNQVYSVSAR